MLVEPDCVRIFTDFRYAERAREVPDTEFEETKRHIYADLAGRLPERVGFEAAALSYADYELLRSGGSSSSPATGSSNPFVRSRTTTSWRRSAGRPT